MSILLRMYYNSRAAFRILLKGGGGGQNSCYRIPGGGQALHAVHYNIYSKISRGGECPP